MRAARPLPCAARRGSSSRPLPPPLEKEQSQESIFRSIVLFGRNVASYKFALAQSLLELSRTGQTLISLEQLAEPFSRHIVSRLERAPKQGTSSSSRFLDACKQAACGEMSTQALIDTTARLGFVNVIDAFHIVHGGEVPVRFFMDERRGRTQAIRLTDDLLRMREGVQFASFPAEVDARWRLVETAWQHHLPVDLVVGYDGPTEQLTLLTDPRRPWLTGARGALNGYQKGRCFYCFDEVSVVPGTPNLTDVDHLLPRTLLNRGVTLPLDGVWNLVLACPRCNRGRNGKFAHIPHRRFLQRLDVRNEFLINSHHPLRETLMAQTGATRGRRQS